MGGVAFPIFFGNDTSGFGSRCAWKVTFNDKMRPFLAFPFLVFALQSLATAAEIRIDDPSWTKTSQDSPGFAPIHLDLAATDGVYPSAWFSLDSKKSQLKSSATGFEVDSTSQRGQRRTRAIRGTAGVPSQNASISIGTSASGLGTQSSSQTASTPIPEPGTFLIGLALLGVCTGGRGRRTGRVC